MANNHGLSAKPNPNYLTPDAVANLCCGKTGRNRKLRTGKGGFKVCCPAHDDTDPSLSINHGKAGTVLKCHAGCAAVEVMAKLGHPVANLFQQYSNQSPKTIHSSVTYSRKDSDYSDNSVNSENSVTNPLLQGMPQSATPRATSDEAIEKALLNLIRWLALDSKMRDGATIPTTALKIVEAWRLKFADKVNVMTIREQVTSMWATVKVPIEEGIVRTAFRKAREVPPKTCPPEFKESEQYELLFGIYYYLAERESDGICYASVRDLDEVLELGYQMKASRMLKTLVSSGVLIPKPEFKSVRWRADRYQLNPDYSSDPNRKRAITVHSWHRFTTGQIANMLASSAQRGQVDEIKKRHGLTFATEDFCRRGVASAWKTDYGRALNPADMEAAVLSFSNITKPIPLVQAIRQLLPMPLYIEPKPEFEEVTI